MFETETYFSKMNLVRASRGYQTDGRGSYFDVTRSCTDFSHGHINHRTCLAADNYSQCGLFLLETSHGICSVKFTFKAYSQCGKS